MTRFSALAFLVLAVAACGGGGGGTDPGPADVPGDVPGDGFPDLVPDAPPDAAAELPGDVPIDLVPDLPSPDAPDVPPADVPVLPDGTAWAPSDPFPADAGFLARHPKAFARMSRFGTHVAGPADQRPNVGHRGAFGAGNGHVFGFVGLADPLNTLHSLVGPTYERRPNFFGDYSIRLARPQDSNPPAFEEEWAGRSLSAPVVMTRGRLGDLELDTIDLAPPGDVDPLPGTGPDLPASCFVRGLLVRNRASQASPAVTIVVSANNAVTQVAPGVLGEAGPERDLRVRTLETRFVGAEGQLAVAQAAVRALLLDLAPIPAGGEVLRVLAHCTGDANGTPAWATAFPPAAPIDPLWAIVDPEAALASALDAAAEAYGAWESGTVQAGVPDPLVADFLDGMKMTLKVQTAATGATCPMSQYTRTWARDNIGPVMAMLAFGAFEDVEAMLDYVYAAIRYGGDLRNSYDADLPVDAAPAAPDWAALAPLSDRVAAETPSYMVDMYGLHHRYTGDGTRASERWGLLRRCVANVGFGVDHLLPFTGDETYRAAMNAAFGLDLEYPHHEKTWSANSTFLWLGAAREYVRLAEVLGDPAGDLQEIRALADQVETESVPRFRLEDGCLAAFAWRDTLAKSPPFEDVALQATWSGWKDGDDPEAQASLDCLVKRLGRAPGEIVSRPDPVYEGMFDSWEGVYTGMLPGYVLAGMTDGNHPQAGDAFAAVRTSLDTSGNLQEYMLFDDHSGLSAAYDPVGGLGDYTSKFRPWEGGIVAEAALRYLVGFRPDATARTVSLRPHLPAGWPGMTFRGLRAGGERFDVTVERGTGGAATVAVSRTSSTKVADWTVDLRWDAPSGAPAFAVDGTALSEGALTRWTSAFGTVSARTPARTLAPAGTVTFTVTAAGL